MIVGLLGILNIYFFLTGLFKVVDLPKDSSTDPAGPRKYNRIVYLLIDGLRFDSSTKTLKEGHIFNKMKHLQSISSKFHALSVSGIPTETGSRVIGLATGTPSNFLTSVANLQGCSIYWDSMVRQLLKDGRSAAFFGDHQWISYFPELRDRTHYIMDPYGRHEIRKQEDEIIEKMLQSVNNYDVIIGHLINLDSYGHIYETMDHEEMERQLIIYDNLINEIYKKMEEDTLFVICSDHGVDNNGAHGGVSTLEMSAVGIFISKDERFIDIPPVEGEVEDLRKKHISRVYDEDPLLIQSKEQHPTIHQDDILPTLCYLMGIPIPKVSSGNFIHELVRDIGAYKTYYKQKCDVLNVTFEDDPKELSEYVRLNYKLSEKMESRFAGRDHFKLVVSGILSAIIALFVIFRALGSRLYKFEDLALSFVIIMTGHSVLSIVHEDLFWAALFFVSNPSLKNLLGSIMLLQMIRPPSDTNLFYVLVIERIKLPPLFNGNLLFVLELFLFGILDSIPHFERTFWFFLNSVLRIFNNHPHVFISLFRYMLGAKTDSASWKLSLFASSPSIDTLIALVFRPMESIYLIYIIRSLDVKKSIYTYFSLANIAFFSCGLQKLFQSINYGVFFTFSDNLLTVPAVVISFFYFIYPRIRAVQIFMSCQPSVNKKERHLKASSFMKDIIAFHNLNLLVVMWSGYAICESLSFYKFLGIRAFFEYLYYICDILLFLAITKIKRRCS
ncbi:glycosylphosphatidylinositol ethanolamine phosphate transferase [Encephalitozoon hellem]|nr:glycosylphosphatidylinositol ethanolamine phosphate transferase [Encephalitozoon hellem]